MMCPAGPDRGRARGGEMPSAGRSSAGWPASVAGDGAHAGGWRRHRLSVQVTGCWPVPGQLSLSRSHAGCHRAGGPLANLVPQAALS